MNLELGFSDADLVFAGSVTVTVTSNPVPDKVDYYVDGVLAATKTAAPSFSWSWDTTGAADGSHTVKSTATYKNNRTVSDSVVVRVQNTVSPPADSTAPSVPGSFTAASVGDTSITTTWTGSTDNIAVTGYNLYKNGVLVQQVGSTIRTYTYGGLTAGTPYSLSIEAFDAMGNKSAKSTISASTLSPPPPPPPSLLAPANLHLVDATEFTLAVAWDAVSGAQGYKVAVSPASAPSDTDYFDVGNTLSYTVANLTPDTDYEVDVIAYSGSILSPWAGRETMTTDAPPAPPPPATLDVPGNFRITATTETTVTIAWSAVANAIGYTVGIALASTPNSVTTTNAGTALSYTFTGLTAGTSYQVKVRAYNDTIQSAFTTVLAATTTAAPTGLVAPTNLRVLAVTSSSIQFAWNAVAGATDYRAAISPKSNPSATTYSDTGGATSKTFTGLAANTVYQVDVLAFNSTQLSPWAGRLDATTSGSAPVPPTGTAPKFALGTSADMNKSAIIGQSLGVRNMRMFDRALSLSVDQIVSDCNIYQSRGIRPYILADVDLRGPYPGNIGPWAAAVGPGGTRAHPTLPVQWIELGNEEFYSYKRTDFVSAAGPYATNFKRCAQAVAAANPNVKCLFMLDIDARGTTAYQQLVNAIYSAVPDIHNYVGGWVFHIYGPMSGASTQKVEQLLNMVGAKGAPSSIGVFITEDGVSSDNGNNLSNNYGWPTNLTYDQAGTILRNKFRDVRAHPAWGSRLRLWTNYQAHDQKPPGYNESGYRNREWFFGVVKQDNSAKGDMTQSVRDHAIAFP